MISQRYVTTILVYLLFIPAISFSQNEDGYWDNARAITKEIYLCADCKTYRQVDFPTGTTEVVYRITLLDEKQQLAHSLSSVLSSIPSPKTIALAGAINLMEKIAGSDKCRYTIFRSLNDADNYYKYGNYQTGCYINQGDVNKDAGRLTFNSNCLKENTTSLWFGFKSRNLLMRQKIVLEIVPWVNTKASRGWTREIKETIINKCKTIEGFNQLSNPEQLCQCFLDKMQNAYTVEDLQRMAPSENSKISKDFAKLCLSETGEIEHIATEKRKQAAIFAKQDNFSGAITIIQEIITNAKPNIFDYNDIGYYYLFTKQYLKSVKFLLEGEKLDETELCIKCNLAHAYLLSGETERAKAIYIKYKNQNVTDKISWIEKIEADFDRFRRAGLPNDNFEIILSIID